MSVDDVSIVKAVTVRLRTLLETARALKQSTSIEPPLSASELEHDILHISKSDSLDLDQATIPSASHLFAALEAASRNVFYELLAQHAISDPSFVQVWNLLDLLQICADHGQCAKELPLWLVEELLDAQTIDGCRRVFDYLESRREGLIKNVRNSQMIVLRSCNELLRRLSRAEDAVFCGRVFIFLFQTFPLGDKSSVNLRGEFHIENTTTFDRDINQSSDETQTQVEEDEISGVAAAEGTEKSTKASALPTITTIDTNEPTESATQSEKIPSAKVLYPVFWSLQSAFSNPPSLFDERGLNNFQRGLELTLEKFRSVPKVTATRSKLQPADNSPTTLGKRKRDSVAPSTTSDLSSAFNPKYLTSFDLFALELSDLTFQRHILVQSLVLIEFLLSLTPKAKSRLATLRAQKSLQYPFELSEEDEKWALSTRTAIANYIKEGPDGHFYYRMVDNILTRDKNWVRWKIESCPPITRDPLSSETVLKAHNGTAGRCRVKKLRPNPMGALDLKFLQQSAIPGITTSAKELAQARPTTEELIRQARNVELDLEFVLPVAEDLAKRDINLGIKEVEMKSRLPPQLVDERSKYREEMKAHLQEKAALEADRASRTWRILRAAARKKFWQLSQVDESKDLTLLSEEAQPGAKAKESKNPAESIVGVSMGLTEGVTERLEARDVSMGDGDAEHEKGAVEVGTDEDKSHAAGTEASNAADGNVFSKPENGDNTGPVVETGDGFAPI